jgi:thiol:disulfide interchange protein DsbC
MALPERCAWPASGRNGRWRWPRRTPLHGPGWVLVGDAAHLVHPLAGQGLNLGLADVATLAEVLAQREPWRALGDTRLLARYARQRLLPTQAMAGVTDALLHLFASPQPLVKELRNRGLTLVNHLLARQTAAHRPCPGRLNNPCRTRSPCRFHFWRKPWPLAAVAALLFCGALSAQEAAIRKALGERLPQLPKIDEISRTPIAGLFEVRYGGTNLLYSDEKGDFIMVNGSMLDTKTRVDLTEARMDKLLAVDFEKLPLKDAMVVRQGNGSRRLAVFADPNCGYCKRFERDLLTVKDVTIYTFLIPILGPDSNTKSRDIWCSKDAQRAWRAWMVDGLAPIKARPVAMPPRWTATWRFRRPIASPARRHCSSKTARAAPGPECRRGGQAAGQRSPQVPRPPRRPRPQT